MGFFDQLSKKTSDAVQSAKDKTSKLSAEMKLKSQISDKKDRITQLYSEIGKEVYENYQKEVNEVTEVIAGKCKEIATVNEELQGLNKELMLLKGYKTCPNCGEQIPSGSEFCPKCGSKVTEVVNAAPENATTVEENKTEE